MIFNPVAFWYRPQKPLENYSWSQISSIAKSGKAADYFRVGDTKTVTLNGKVGEGLTLSNFKCKVTIIGINHKNEKGITFGLWRDIDSEVAIAFVDSRYGDTTNDTDDKDMNGKKYFSMYHWGYDGFAPANYGGWSGADLRYDVLGSTNRAPYGYGSASYEIDVDVSNPSHPVITPTTKERYGYDATSSTATSPISGTFMAALPSDLRAVMRPMTVYTDNEGGYSVSASNVTATVDYLPLLSPFEIDADVDDANPSEAQYQEQYEYFKLYDDIKLYKHNNTSSQCDSFLRSPSFYGLSYQQYFTENYMGTSYRITSTYSVFSAGDSLGLSPIFRV